MAFWLATYTLWKFSYLYLASRDGDRQGLKRLVNIVMLYNYIHMYTVVAMS